MGTPVSTKTTLATARPAGSTTRRRVLWTRGVAWVPLAAAFLGVAWFPQVATAQVKVKMRADGTTMIYNESSKQRTRRLSSKLQPLTTGSELSRLIGYYARREGMSPRLVQAVVQVESGYNSRALSNKGAMGLMQLMPGTAKELGVSDAYDPEQNIRGGTRYLKQQLNRFSGDLRLALAAYNAGPTAVAKYGDIPPYRETRRYVEKVLALYRHTAPPHLQEVARDQAKKRHLEAARRHVEEQQQRGRKVYLTRGEDNRIKITTAPPKLN